MAKSEGFGDLPGTGTGVQRAKVGHTPGPWSFRPLSGDDGLGYIEADGRDIVHAGVADRPRVENVANAHLIAAAPAMYRVLEFVESCLEAQANVGGVLTAVEREMLERVRAALSKALGEGQ